MLGAVKVAFRVVGDARHARGPPSRHSAFHLPPEGNAGRRAMRAVAALSGGHLTEVTHGTLSAGCGAGCAGAAPAEASGEEQEAFRLPSLASARAARRGLS